MASREDLNATTAMAFCLVFDSNDGFVLLSFREIIMGRTTEDRRRANGRRQAMHIWCTRWANNRQLRELQYFEIFVEQRTNCKASSKKVMNVVNKNGRLGR